MRKLNLSLFLLEEIMATFNCGERVRMMESGRPSDKVFLIKRVKQCKKGGTLYLLKTLEEKSVLRLYYEKEESILERIC